MQIALIVFLLLSFESISSQEMFSAVETLEVLFKEEKKVLELLSAEQIAEVELKEKLEKWKSEHEKAQENFIEYIGNPLNAFLLIKRMVVDYQEIKGKLGVDAKYFQPDESDLRGAVEGLLRLQVFYKQKSAMFARGVIDGVKTREGLTPHDLYVIGREARKIADNEYFAADYLLLAWASTYMEEFNEFKSTLIKEILGLVNETEYFENQVFELYENDDSREEMRDVLLTELINYKISLPSPYVDSFEKKGYYVFENEMIFYGQICRGEVEKSSKEKAKLFCKYVSNTPFSRLAPFKVEEASLYPYIVIYYDAIYDNEIEILKKLSKSKITRSMVTDNKGTGLKISNNIRVAQVAGVDGSDDKLVEAVNRRVEVSLKRLNCSCPKFYET